jgi:DNA-binding transcriptional LysR family regulator
MVGTPLFQRSAGGYLATPSGVELLGYAEEVEAVMDTALKALGRPGVGFFGKIRVSAPDGFGNHFLASRLQTFVSRYPSATVELIAVPQILSLSQREGDIAVTLSEPTRGRFRSRKLADYRLGIYAGDAYLDQGTVESAALRQHRFVGYVDELIFSRELDYLSEISPGIRAHIQCTSLQAQVSATLAGGGLCVLPVYIAGQVPGLRRVADETQLRRSYWLSVHEDLADSPKVRAMAEFIEQASSNFPDF